MALLVFESFSCCSGVDSAARIANFGRRSTYTSGSGIMYEIADPLSGIMIKCSTDIDAQFQPDLVTTGLTMVYGVRMYVDEMVMLNSREFFVTYSNEGLLYRLNIDPYGSIQVTRAYTVIARGGLGVIRPKRHYFIEMKIGVGNSVDVEVRVDGVTVISETGVDTDPFTNSIPVLVRTEFEGSYDTGMSTFYCCDTTGSTFNDFLGGIHGEVIRPDGDGNRNNWTKLSGTTNYEMVDEAQEDGETSYVSTATAGNDDLYTFTALTLAMDTILGVQVRGSFRPEDGGHRTVRALTRSSATEATGDSKPLNSDRYRHVTGLFETDPNTAVAWTEAGVNAAEFGFELDN